MAYRKEPLELTSELFIPSARLNVHLGYNEDERALAQEVNLSIRIQFPVLPPACQTDELRDTICYAQIINSLRGYLFKQRYSLIERLGYDIYTYINEKLPDQTQLGIKITKLYPPLEKVPEGVAFILGDFR